jgi:hypothetical protein
MRADVRALRKFGHNTGQAFAVLLSHRNVHGAARKVTTPKPAPKTKPLSPHQPENHAENAGTPKNHAENRL